MPTAREIRDSNEAAALAAKLRGTAYESLLDDHPVERIETETGLLCVQVGPIQVLEGQDPAKPVIRDAKTKRTMAGSGRMKRKEDTALVAGDKAYRQTTEYRERFAQLMPEGDVDEIGSDAWWMDRAIHLAMGSPTEVDCPHPELHTADMRRKNGTVKHMLIQKPDNTVVNNLLRMRFGNAPQTVNVNKQEHRLIESLEHRVLTIDWQGIDPADITSRKALIEGVMAIEAEMVSE